MSIKRRLCGLATAVAMLGGILTVASTPAQAASSYWIYVSMPTWLGNCPQGGSVKLPEVTAWFGGDSSYASDYGDDLVWIRVGANTNTTIVASGLCYNGTRSWPAAASYNTIHATRTGQTWWVGPYGTRRN
jgi:hypothetical protein